MKPYQAVFFDFDYTLGDTASSIVAGFRYAFEQMGLPLPDGESVKGTIGLMLSDGYRLLSGDESRAGAERFRELYTQRATPLQIEQSRLFPGAEELLEALVSRGIPVGVVSSKRTSTLRAVLEARGILKYLASVTGGDMVARPKPDPEGLLTAIVAAGLTPDQILYCGDTVIDAETAQRAGAHFSAVLNGTTPASAFEAYPHDHIAPDLAELQTWLELDVE